MSSKSLKGRKRTAAAKPTRKRKSRHRTKAELAVEREEQLIEQQSSFLKTILSFKHFLSSGFEPTISDAEIVVCFADVRGFTAYCRKLQEGMQDRKIQNFLRDYFKIFNEGLLGVLISNDYREEIEKIGDHLVPTMYKNLGDGLMMVWEMPAGLENLLQGRLTQLIVTVIQEIESRFYSRFRTLGPVEIDAYSREVTKLRIGFGVAKGHAWRLDFGNNIDYAGSIINLASRLASVARPNGVIAHYDVSPWLFDQMMQDRFGKIVALDTIKGYEPGIQVWCSPDVRISKEMRSLSDDK